MVRRACAMAVSVAVLTAAAVSEAATVAYWRFEEGAAGQIMPHTSGKTDWSAYGAVDHSGHGNHLFAFNDTFGGHVWDTRVPGAAVPATGQSNQLSIRNLEGAPGMFTGTHAVSATGTNLQTWAPSVWTIEASFYQFAGGFRTIVGKDGDGTALHDGALAPLYFQTVGDGRLAIKFNDVAGNHHAAYSTVTIELNRWYHAAAVSDGDTLSLYLDSLDGNGYVLQESIALVTVDARMASAGSTFSWSVGRGWHNGGDVDRWEGLIDEVRISDAALTPDQFLFYAVPEPASAVLMAGGAVLMLRRRRR